MSWIHYRVEEAIRHPREQALEQLLRSYVPERYPITVKADQYGYDIVIGSADGARIDINADENLDIVEIELGVIEAFDGTISLEDVVDNLRAALELAEQDKLNEALMVLAQEKEVV